MNIELSSIMADHFATLVLVSAFLGLVAWLVVRHFVRRRGRLPPGPLGLPFVGVLPFMMREKHLQNQLTKWGEQYGSIYSMYVGQQLTVVLNDYEAIRAALIEQSDNFTGRPRNVIFEPFMRNGNGIIVAEGDYWRDLRRFLLKSFRDLGVGKSRFELLCLEEADSLVEQLLTTSKNNENGFEPKNIIFFSVANIICGLVYGKRFLVDDKRLLAIVDNQRHLDNIGQQAGPIVVFPWLRYTPPVNKAWKGILKLAEANAQFSEPEVQHLIQKFGKRAHSEEEPHCVVEQFLARREPISHDNKSEERASTDKMSSTDSILANIETIFGAGTDTSVMTLVWAMAFFLHYPEVQQKGYEEIINKIGTDRPVGWDDRHELPYVEAILLEVWRRANLVPLSLQRRNLHDTHIDGYFIPKHTTIITNLWNVHRDARYFPEPMKFQPERFIDSKSGKVERNASLMPFSAGKRSCVGETIARMELFIFLANMLRRIEVVKPENGEALPDLDDFVTGIVVHPRLFKISVRNRK